VAPGDLRNALPASAPDSQESIDAILRDFRELVVPANTHWNHPRFHAYFSVSASGLAFWRGADCGAERQPHAVEVVTRGHGIGVW
jgi:hypothetical protein